MSITLDLNFARDKSLVAAIGPTLTCVRADPATYYDSSGVMQIASANIPRWDHLPVSPFTSRGLLRERASINLFLQSEDATTSWTNISSNNTANAADAPDGNTTADKLYDDSSPSTVHYLAQTVATTAASAYTFSRFFKAAEYDYVALYAAGPNDGKFFNLAAGTVLGNLVGAPDAAGIEDVGGGIYRCWIRITATAATTNFRTYLSTNGTSETHSGDGASGVYHWGAQVELGWLTSYIPTTTTSLPRANDLITSTDMSWYNQLLGKVFYIKATPSEDTASGVDSLVIVVGAAPSGIYFTLASAQNNALRADHKTFAGDDGLILKNSEHQAGVETQFAVSVVTGRLNGYANGNQLVTPGPDLSVTVGDAMTLLEIGSHDTFDTAYQWSGHIARIVFDNELLDDAVVQAMSTGKFPGGSGRSGPGLTFGGMGRMGA